MLFFLFSRAPSPPPPPPIQSIAPQARCIVPVGRVARPAVFTRSVAAKAPESATYVNEEKVRGDRERERWMGFPSCSSPPKKKNGERVLPTRRMHTRALGAVTD